MPNPLRSWEDQQRFTHADLADMTPAAKQAESFRWKVALASVEDDQVPSYVLERLTLLEAA